VERQHREIDQVHLAAPVLLPHHHVRLAVQQSQARDRHGHVPHLRQREVRHGLPTRVGHLPGPLRVRCLCGRLHEVPDAQLLAGGGRGHDGRVVHVVLPAVRATALDGACHAGEVHEDAVWPADAQRAQVVHPGGGLVLRVVIDAGGAHRTQRGGAGPSVVGSSAGVSLHEAPHEVARRGGQQDHFARRDPRLLAQRVHAEDSVEDAAAQETGGAGEHDALGVQREEALLERGVHRCPR